MRRNIKFFKYMLITLGLIFSVFQLWAKPSPTYGATVNKKFHFKGKMAFTAHVDGNWELFIITETSGAPIRLTHTLVDERTPHWSLDGGKIIYATTDDQIALIEVNTKKVTHFSHLKGKNVQPDLDPCGKKIIYVHFNPKIKEDTDLLIFSIGQERAERFLRQPSAQYHPRLSPDGSKVVYTHVHCYPDHGRIIQELWLAEATGYHPRQLLLTNSMCIDPDWSPEGREIAFSSDMNGNFDIWIYNCERKDLTQVTKDANLDCNPCWSADGKSLAFVSNRTGKMAIWIKDLKTGEVNFFNPFGEKPVMCKEIDWSP